MSRVRTYWRAQEQDRAVVNVLRAKGGLPPLPESEWPTMVGRRRWPVVTRSETPSSEFLARTRRTARVDSRFASEPDR